MTTERLLRINGIAIPVHASVRLSQRYEEVRASYPYRMRDGTRKQRTLWQGKLATQISGSGLIPSGLSSFDYSASLTLSCFAPRDILSASPNIDIPAARRTDSGSEPYGRAFVGGDWVATPVAMNVNQAQLTPVSGATMYQVIYFPEILVFADPPREELQERGPSYGWTMTAEEV